MLKAFFSRLASVPHAVCFLDYDGTLAPFRVEREKAYPYPGVRHMLYRMLEEGHSRIVIVSGRPAKDVLRLLDLPLGLEVWGVHGLERRMPNGSLERMPLPQQASVGLAKARHWLKARALESHMEEKPGSIAFHIRGMPPDDADRMLAEVKAELGDLAEAHGLELHDFDGGVEMRLPGITKARCVQTILAEYGSKEEVAAAYLGDDRTDEDAFRALDGRGLSVLVRPERRPSLAQVWLQPPQELIMFLRQWHEIRGGHG